MKTKILAFRIVVFALVFVITSAMLPQIKAQADNPKVPETVFSNTAPITINSSVALTAPTKASLYPSAINVAGMTSTTTRVQVSLRGLQHSQVADLDFLLVGPGGQKFIFLSDPSTFLGGARATAPDGVYTFADDAPIGIPSANFFPPGFYKPGNVNDGSDTFPAPAPAAPYSSTTFATNFNGTSPNGTWSLYAVDDTLHEAGAVYSGWELTITTDGAPQTFANNAYIGLEEDVAHGTPYPSAINVSGLTGVVSNLKVTLNNLTASTPDDIEILLVNPNGAGIVILSDAGGSAANNASLTFDDAAADFLTTPVVSGTYKPTNFNDGATDFFPAYAPPAPYLPSNLSSFKNFSPNGAWRLYVVDDAGNASSGTIAGGWSLDITTAPPTAPPTACAAPNLTSVQYAADAGPTNLAVGDFNNDGKQDLAVTNQVSNDVSILLNNGSGGFNAPINVVAGNSPYAVAVGLFNNDANQDLAVVNSGSNTVSILLGNGDGTFAAPVNFTTGASPISITVGDFNNDNKRDLAIANFGGFFSGSVSILLGNGNGGFTFAPTLRTSTQPAFVKAANINSDANPDLVVANFGANTVSIFLGNGNGTFTLNQTLNTLNGPVAVEIADVTGDGIQDLIVANYNASSLQTFTSPVNGTFSLFANTSVGANPISVVATDSLGDGVNRIAVALNGTNQIAVSILGGGVFQPFTVGLNPNAIVKGDFNGDGKADLATANFGSDSVTLLTNTCVAPHGNIFDFNGDRRTDIAVYRPSAGFWSIFGQNGQYFFGRDRDIIVPADYDGDAKTDFAFYRPETSTWIVQKNPFYAGIGTTYYLQFGIPTDIPSPADFDGDGKADLAVFRPSTGTWYVRRSSDNSTQSVPFGMDGDKPVAADYDGDGKADIAVFRPSNGTWYILGTANGFFAVPFGMNGDRTAQGDYDGDGKTDIAIFRNGIWYILKSSDGNYLSLSFGIAGDVPVPGEYDGDGRFDLAVFRPSQGIWYILRSSDGGSQAIQYGLATDVPVPSAYSR